MSKVSEFYAKALADEAAKKELITILGDNKIEEASDEQLVKVGDLAKKLGYDITVDEAKAYLNGDDTELDEDDLDAVAGGKGDSGGDSTGNGSGNGGNIEQVKVGGDCVNGVGGINVDVNF